MQKKFQRKNCCFEKEKLKDSIKNKMGGIAQDEIHRTILFWKKHWQAVYDAYVSHINHRFN